MIRSLTRIENYNEHHWFVVFSVLLLGCTWLGTALSFFPLAFLPIGLMFAFVCITNPKLIFYFFFFLLPFSIEIELPGGFGTDIPSEPIMIALLGICILFAIMKPEKISKNFLLHPVSLLLFCHLFWIGFTSLFAVNKIFAFKYLLAKCWYIFPFYFLPAFLFKDFKDFRLLFKLFMIGLTISVVYVVIRHALTGFSYMGINEAVRPIYRNHVNYSAILVVCLPYLWYLRKYSNHKWIYSLVFLFFMVAVYLTFTRAAYVVVIVAIAGYFMVKWRLTKLAAAGLLVATIAFTSYLIKESRYLALAPNYERTVAHTKFDNLVSATYKMEDISTMERLYRWVAGFQMVKERPITGFGPSNFYTNYKQHSVSSFQTYVSDNPEKSGIHNNYLMVFVEQGFIGFIIMMLLAFVPAIIGERIYHQLTDEHNKTLLMAAILCFLGIDVMILINDLLEADKVGPLFFLSASIIAMIGARVKDK